MAPLWSMWAGAWWPAVCSARLQRLAQLTYTATQYSMPVIALCQPKQASTCVVVGKQLASRVRFLQNGVPLVLKGSGIDFTKPVSRATFGEFTPAIFVESPTVGEKVRSPFLVWGTANTREAAIWLQVQTADGATVLKKRVTATSGTERGARSAYACRSRPKAEPAGWRPTRSPRLTARAATSSSSP